MQRRIPILLTLCVLFVASDLLAQRPEGRRGGRRRGGRRMMRDDNAPKAGEKAPTFTLKTLDGKSEFSLESAEGKKPVLLFFGSYT